METGKVWKEAQGLGGLGQSSRRGLALKERRVDVGGRWSRAEPLQTMGWIIRQKPGLRSLGEVFFTRGDRSRQAVSGEGLLRRGRRAWG